MNSPPKTPPVKIERLSFAVLCLFLALLFAACSDDEEATDTGVVQGTDTASDTTDDADDADVDSGDIVDDETVEDVSDELITEVCTAIFTWLQKDAYKESAGRNSQLWPPHTTTQLLITCDSGPGADDLIANTFMANHGTEPGAVDAEENVILQQMRQETATADRATMLGLATAFEACECDSEFLSMDALEDETIQSVVGRLVTYIQTYLVCSGDTTTEGVIGSLQAGDIEALIAAIPDCTWEEDHDWTTGLSDAAAAVVGDVEATLDDYHVCNNDAVLQTTLWEDFSDSGAVVACNGADADVCNGPMWFYTP